MKGTVISLIDKSMRRTTASLCRGMKFDVIYDDPNFDLSEPTKAVRPGEIVAVVATLLKV